MTAASRSSLSLLLFAAVFGATLAQLQPDLQLNLCSLKNGTLLGWETGSNLPVYNRFCGGLCLNAVDQKFGTTCRPSAYTYRTIRVVPHWFVPAENKQSFRSRINEVPAIPFLFRTVKIPTKCSCLPPPCIVNGREIAHGASASNECGEKCTCSYGRLINCCRQRKSILHMPRTERLRFMQTLYDVSRGNAGAALKAEYDALVADHETAFHSGIHAEGELLPWHRNFILMLENILRKVDCRVTVPYYAWELTSADPWGSMLWNPSVEWYGGGSGNACVTDGKWEAPWTLAPSAGNGCLRRVRSGSVPTPADVATLLATPAASFSSFNSLLNSMHGGFHCAVSGTMCTLESANAPEFTLHHGNMDRLWAKWQAISPAHKNSFNAEIDTVMTPSSIVGGITPRQVMDISNHLGVCVNYVEPGFLPIFNIIDIMAKLPQLTLLSLPVKQQDFTPAVEKWIRIHENMTAADMKSIQDGLNILNGRPVARELSGAGEQLGVDPIDLANAIIELDATNADTRIDTKLLQLPQTFALLNRELEKLDDQPPEDSRPRPCY